jgi:hypothetical protein
MVDYKYNHIVPSFIMHNFRIPQSKHGILVFNKGNKNYEQRNIKNKHGFYNLKYFYSREPIQEVIKIIPGAEINPLLALPDKILEINLERFIESPFKTISEKIINDIPINNEEEKFIKEYSLIQRLRNTKFKEDFKKVNEKIIGVPKEFRKDLINETNAILKKANSNKKVNPKDRKFILEEQKQN